MFFVIYYFGSDLTDSNNASGNFVQSSVGNIFASGNFTLFDLIQQSVSFKASNISDTNLKSSTPTTASISLVNSETDIAITSINIITPDSAFEGEEKVPILYAEIQSDVETDSGLLTIKNGQSNFQIIMMFPKYGYLKILTTTNNMIVI